MTPSCKEDIRQERQDLLIGKSHDFCRAYSLFVAGIASFAPERSESSNDAIRDTNKLYARQKSCDYHYYQYTRPNRTDLFHKERLFNMKSCCGLQIPLHFAVWPAKRSVLLSTVCHLAASSDNNGN